MDKENIKFQFPEDIEIINDYLSKLGIINYSLEQLEKLYKTYTKEVWCADWVRCSPLVLLKFVIWLNEKNMFNFNLRKHGQWIYNPKDAIEMMFTLPKCSECGAESSDSGNYCSNCGAAMDEVK